MTPNNSDVPGALHGLRVVEVAGGVAGAYCGKLLAMCGADVVRIEALESVLEGNGRHLESKDEDRAAEQHLHTGKRSIALEVGAGPAVDAATRLFQGADVLIWESATVDGPLRDAAERERDQESLVLVDIVPFGPGPRAGNKASEIVLDAVGGYMHLTGLPDREPLKPYGHLAEYNAGVQAALATVAAVANGSRRGESVLVESVRGATTLLGTSLLMAHFFGSDVKRNGTRPVGFPPETAYPTTIRPCRDGYVHCHGNTRHRDLLAVLTGAERLAEPDLLATMLGHADEIDGILDLWLSDRRREEVVEEAQSMRLPFAEVRTIPEVVGAGPADASLVSLSSTGDALYQPASPILLSRTPVRITPAPAWGHTSAVWAEWRPRESRPELLAAPDRAQDAPGGPLAGVRVIDFTHAAAGPMTARLLAELGAEVVRIEAPNGRPAHPTEAAPILEGAPHRPAYDRMLLFNELNHGKKSVSIDATVPEGRELLLELVQTADMFVENFSERVVEQLGLTFDELSRRHPELIYVSIKAFRKTSPFAHRTAYGPGVEALAGLSDLTGYSDSGPMKPGNYFVDQFAAAHAAFGAVVAWVERATSGRGQHVEVPLYDCCLQVVGDAILEFQLTGRMPTRIGNADASCSPHGLFPCSGADQWVAIAIRTEQEWGSLCEVLGHPDLTKKLSSTEDRRTHEADVTALISDWTRRRTPAEAEQTLQQHRIPAGAVLTPGDVLRDAHMLASGAVGFVEMPSVGPAPYSRSAFELAGAQPLGHAAPGFGEHNTEVLSSLLRLNSSRITELIEMGVVCDAPLGAVRGAKTSA